MCLVCCEITKNLIAWFVVNAKFLILYPKLGRFHFNQGLLSVWCLFQG